MKKLLFLLICFPFFLSSQASKKYPGLLWKITGKGLKKPSFLYGTMHVSNRVAYHLSEEFFDALRSVDVVGLETNPAEWLANMELTGELSELTQMRQSSYDKDFYRGAFAVSFPEKRMLQSILSYDPDIINGLLYRQNNSRENFEENTYIDLFIYQSAAKLNKKVISLEDFTQAEIKARLSALPDEEKDRNNNGRNSFYSSVQKIEDAYRDGDLDLIDSLSKLTSSRNMQKYLINDRNVFFVQTMDSVLRSSSIFAGVGAAHLAGAEGVIELLRTKGYVVEPVITRVTRKSNAERDALDKKIKPVVFSRQFASDSLFSIDLPGKLYPIVNTGNLRYDIHADMANGSFYTVARLKYNGPVFNMSADQLLSRVDSLLFEHIPGKITQKKTIEVSGVKGIDLVNRTRRGDEQHYQIFFTSQEMILFKLGGKNTYASGNEAKQVFGSLKFYFRGNQPVEFSPKTKGFSVKVPAGFSYVKNDGTSLAGPVEDLFAYDSDKKECYGVKRAIYNDFNYLEEDTFELNRLAANVLRSYRRDNQTRYEPASEQGFPAIRFSGENSAGSRILAKVIIKGVHYYLVYLITPQKDANFDHPFFQSFRLNDFQLVNPVKEINDKDLHFRALDEVSDNALSRFNEAYVQAYEATRAKKETSVNRFGFYSGNKLYYSPSSNEYVSITYEKYNDYDYRDPAEMVSKIEESFRKNTSLFVKRKTASVENGVKKYNFILGDTGTTRAIDVRIFFKAGLMHEVCAPFDTTIGLQGWTKNFMESFRPADTLIGKDIFENKFQLLLNDLAGSDSVKQREAATSLAESVSMQKDYATEFTEFLSDKRFPALSEENRALLFVNGGAIGTNSIIAPYKKFYAQYKDSFYLQLCILKGLALLQTSESYAAFNELLLSETPLAGDEKTISDVFNVLYDSVSLCRSFFPGFLSLTRYEEYRNPVYSLLAQLVNDELLPSAKYAGGIKQLVSDADLALKRFNAGSRTGQSEKSAADKAASDLEMAIRSSLEGMAVANMKPEDRADDQNNKHHLVNYATVLAPFYKTDQKVRDFMQKLSMIRSPEITMPVAILLLKQKIILNDTLLTHFAGNKFTRVYFYTILKKEGLEKYFDKRYLSQESFISAVLSSQRRLNNLYSYDEKNAEQDSIVLLKKIKASNKFQKGDLYVYRNVSEGKSDKQWSAVFVADSPEQPATQMEVITSGYFPDQDKTETENVNELLEYFTLSYRKRALANQGNYE